MKTSYENDGAELTFSKLESEIDAGRRAIVVLAALELGIFDHLPVDRERSVDHIAEAIGVSTTRLTPLLEALAAMGYLLRGQAANHFSIHPDASQFLSNNSPDYRGIELMRWVRTLRGWSWLSEVIRRDEQRYVGSLSSKGKPTHDTHLCLHARGKRSGLDLIEMLELPPPHTVLDLGGGTGGYTQALLETFPDAEVTLFDRPEVIGLARQDLHIETYGTRLTLVGGDFLEKIPAGPFDLVLLANVLHIFEPSVVKDIIGRAALSVVPGGALVVRDGMVEPDRRSPESALLFGIHMIVFSNHGRIYSTDEMVSMVESADLKVAHTFRTTPDIEGAVVVSKKPL